MSLELYNLAVEYPYEPELEAPDFDDEDYEIYLSDLDWESDYELDEEECNVG